MIYMQMIETEEEKDDFQRLYEAYKNSMFYAALQILHNEQDAEDAVHHAFIKIAENMEKIDAPICPKTKSYAVTITENQAIDMFRKKRKHPQVEFEEEMMGILAEYRGENELAGCILRLPGRYREIILLKYVHGYSVKEIAAMLGLTNANAGKLEQRAKKKLRKLCEMEGIL